MSEVLECQITFRCRTRVQSPVHTVDGRTTSWYLAPYEPPDRLDGGGPEPPTKECTPFSFGLTEEYYPVSRGSSPSPPKPPDSTRPSLLPTSRDLVVSPRTQDRSADPCPRGSHQPISVVPETPQGPCIDPPRPCPRVGHVQRWRGRSSDSGLDSRVCRGTV